MFTVYDRKLGSFYHNYKNDFLNSWVAAVVSIRKLLNPSLTAVGEVRDFSYPGNYNPKFIIINF